MAVNKLATLIIIISITSCAYKPIALNNQKGANNTICFTLSKSVADFQSIYSIAPKEYQDKYEGQKEIIFKYKISDFLTVSKDCGLNAKLITGISTTYKMISDTAKAAHEFRIELEINSQTNKIVKFKASERSPYYSSLTHTNNKKSLLETSIISL